MKDQQKLVQTDGIDLATFGQQLRHLRRARGLTLTELGERVGRAPSVLSLLENGRREPKLSLIEQLAVVLSVPVTELLSRQPPSRRAQLEIALADAQQDPSYRRLGLPQLKVGARVPTDVLEHLVAVAAELRAQGSKPTATPEEARAANAARAVGSSTPPTATAPVACAASSVAPGNSGARVMRRTWPSAASYS